MSNVNAAARLLQDSLAKLIGRHMVAKTAKEKKELGKSIAHTRAQIKALQRVKK